MVKDLAQIVIMFRIFVACIFFSIIFTACPFVFSTSPFYLIPSFHSIVNKTNSSKSWWEMMFGFQSFSKRLSLFWYEKRQFWQKESIWLWVSTKRCLSMDFWKLIFFFKDTRVVNFDLKHFNNDKLRILKMMISGGLGRKALNSIFWVSNHEFWFKDLGFWTSQQKSPQTWIFGFSNHTNLG